MARNIPLEQLKIASPCTEDWEGMQGDGQKRFCGKCRKHVHNLREYDRAEAEALIAQSACGGHVCVQMQRDAHGVVITRDYWKVAAGVALAAGISMSTGCDKVKNGWDEVGYKLGFKQRPMLKGDVAPAMGTPVPLPPPPPNPPPTTGSPAPVPSPAPPPALLGEAVAPPPEGPVIRGDICPPPPPPEPAILGKVAAPR